MLDFIQIFILLGLLIGPSVYLHQHRKIGTIWKWIYALTPVVSTAAGYWIAQLCFHTFDCQYEQQQLACVIAGEDWSAWIGYGSFLGIAAIYAGIPISALNVYWILRTSKNAP